MMAPSVRRRGQGCRGRADQRLEPVHVAERQRLQLLGAEAAGVHLDAALAAAEGHVRDGRLPGHFRGKHLEEVERETSLVEAGAALVRAARLVVLDAVGLEALGPPRDHLVEALALEPDHAVAHREIRADQRPTLEDEAAVEQRLEAVRQQLAVGQVLELVRILGQWRETGVQFHRDVEMCS